MGKRSNFEKNPRDYYRTFDPKAGIALEPFVERNAKYIEPFAGAGDLIQQLKFADCVLAYDIEPQACMVDQADAFTIGAEDLIDVDLCISNPPWSKDIFHKALDHFVPFIDCWFLMSSSWKQNKGSAEYVSKWLTDIVPIGRMKWIEGSPHSSVDDCEWLKFSYWKNDAARFHPRG
jgi:hypothetical protein